MMMFTSHLWATAVIQCIKIYHVIKFPSFQSPKSMAL